MNLAYGGSGPQDVDVHTRPTAGVPIPFSISTSVWLTIGVALVAAALAATVGELVALGVRRLGRKHEILATLAQRGRRPLAGFLGTIAAIASLSIYTQPADWREPTLTVLRLVAVAFGAGLAIVAANVVQDVLLLRYRIDVADNRRQRQRRTQVALVKRLVVALIIVVAVAAMLLTIPGARGIGTSVLASAGLLSVVAGLAAQTSLANVFAGLQIAFTDAVRVDDVVVIEDEYGNIEDITLTYVVVRLWDQRRLILPSTYFTTTPFVNWTRNSADIIGAVELSVDWTVPVEQVRSRAERFVRAHELFNGQTFSVAVTETSPQAVTLRVLVSADSGGDLFDLRCAVREDLVGFLQREHPDALPKVRLVSPGSDSLVHAPAHVPAQVAHRS
ncbi:mechanosensitive ion channel domain-containing protein [Kineococcus endophyticus]|uniref:Mechanosensitive ion channel domain-containing protein n=1 Tax=Kineococcus endophyticus TaxID=1181883 RepID=A0ABV3P9J3_9ACTN